MQWVDGTLQWVVTEDYNNAWMEEVKKSLPSRTINSLLKVWAEDKLRSVSEANLLASSENKLVLSDFFTVINNTGGDIWVQPDNNELDPVLISPGELIDFRVDGITHPSYPNQVYKVISYLDVIFGIEATSNSIEIKGIWANGLNESLGGGWLSNPPNVLWNKIFEKAGWKP